MRTFRKFLVAIALFALPAAAVNAQTATPAASKVTAATVFLNCAELTQTATVTLQKGANEVLIGGLAKNIDQNSLKVNAPNGIVVSAYDFSRDVPSAPRTGIIRDSVKLLTAQLARIDVDIQIKKGMLSLLSQGTNKSVSGSEDALGIEELKKTIDYFSSQSSAIINGERELREKRNNIDAAIERLQAEMLGSGASDVLRLSVSSPAAGSFPVTISYVAYDAGWSPYYDINVVSADGPVKFAAKSRVWQKTNIDWKGVKLTLSTNVPSGGKVAPLFSIWFLHEVYPMPMTRRSENVAMQNSISYDMKMEEAIVLSDDVEESPAAGMADYITATDNAIAVTYNIDLPYTIPGNGKEQNIDLLTTEAPAEYKYYCAPKLDPAVYLVAEIPNWQNLGLLSAPANITYDGTYIGRTQIDASATNENLSLTLGTDKRVTVKRELTRNFGATKTIGSNIERTFTYDITVRNGQSAPIAMVFKDQYPVSTDKTIVVTLDAKTTTPPSVNRVGTGVLTWEETLPAGEIRTYTTSYTVRYPKDLRLNL